MTLCACGHDFTDHYQTDVEYLCILCSWCDGYTKAAANDSATAPVPAGGTPEGLAREKVEMTDSEVKPSSPTTEAGRILEKTLDFHPEYCSANGPDPCDCPLLPSILAIEQQAREGGYRSGLLEGRREAVCPGAIQLDARIVDWLIEQTGKSHPHDEPPSECGACAAYNYLSEKRRVAGLNASESPRKQGCIYKHPHPDHECRNQDDLRGAASESGQEHTPGCVLATEGVSGHTRCRCRCHHASEPPLLRWEDGEPFPVGDASESGQPSEASDE